MGATNLKTRALLQMAKDNESISRESHKDASAERSDFRNQSQETSDERKRVIAYLGCEHRVIFCRDGIRWIAQRRKTGGAERPWRSLQSREALILFCATLCGRFDAAACAALAALPEFIGGAK